MHLFDSIVICLNDDIYIYYEKDLRKAISMCAHLLATTSLMLRGCQEERYVWEVNK